MPSLQLCDTVSSRRYTGPGLFENARLAHRRGDVDSFYCMNCAGVSHPVKDCPGPSDEDPSASEPTCTRRPVVVLIFIVRNGSMLPDRRG